MRSQHFFPALGVKNRTLCYRNQERHVWKYTFIDNANISARNEPVKVLGNSATEVNHALFTVAHNHMISLLFLRKLICFFCVGHFNIDARSWLTRKLGLSWTTRFQLNTWLQLPDPKISDSKPALIYNRLRSRSYPKLFFLCYLVVAVEMRQEMSGKRGGSHWGAWVRTLRLHPGPPGYQDTPISCCCALNCQWVNDKWGFCSNAF